MRSGKASTEKASFGQILQRGEGVSQACSWRKNIPGRGNARCRSHEVQVCLVYSKSGQDQSVWAHTSEGPKGGGRRSRSTMLVRAPS